MFSLYKKEIQSFFYSPFAYVLSALFMLIFGFAFVNKIASMQTSVLQFSFPDMFYNNFFYFIFIIPLLTMRSFADERRGGTEVQLLTSPLTITQIVLAKFFAIVTVFLFMLLLSLFFPIYVALHGTVIWSSLICGYASFFLWGLVCIALGMLFSSMQSSPIIAAIIGEIVMEGFLFLDQFAATKMVQSYPHLNSVVTWFSMQRRFVFFAQGMFRLEDLVFFLSLTALVLFWNVLYIEKRRWNHR
ncbi:MULTISPECIES: ABC transporter permease [Ruminococcus]|uniref:Putative membrane protein n=1 Tax=Ruminococcus albus 8 TaxID=246199 RepID=E9SAW1_RUMAL|nr:MULTISPECIES: ABC transporter permease [Ruminococcus]MBE6872443.1 ABC transporter permease [Ruminococcus albus]EGC03663.1 putative membrane protein [Ruminococcus albus 8]MBO5558599.1 ABC transporter permease subunit [Ruminococcus sp.]MBQ9541854.1 ABC transporter permease subunit [Ruminococcus sp.]MBR0529611.1 ABC transporter permease subunit [Ruminococcus sp.]